MSEAGREQATELGFRPLYTQVRERLTRRISDGEWPPGSMLPSEAQIAAELRVSQGTVRKALDEMTAASLLVRRQGRGTFVARHDEARVLFRFFHLTPDAGPKVFPESVVAGVERRLASEAERERLALARRAQVIVIRRRRLLNGAAAVTETVTLPAAAFAGLETGPVPNNLYDTYATRFGVTVAGGEEKLKAVAADAEAARDLQVAEGTPLLLIDRLAVSIDGAPVEWRTSLCATEAFHYLSVLG